MIFNTKLVDSITTEGSADPYSAGPSTAEGPSSEHAPAEEVKLSFGPPPKKIYGHTSALMFKVLSVEYDCLGEQIEYLQGKRLEIERILKEVGGVKLGE